MRGEIRRVGVRRIELVLLDPGDTRAIGVGQIDSGRLIGGRARDENAGTILVHVAGIPIAGLGQALWLARAEIIDRINVLLEHSVPVGGEEKAMLRFVDADEAGQYALPRPAHPGEEGFDALGALFADKASKLYAHLPAHRLCPEYKAGNRDRQQHQRAEREE